MMISDVTEGLNKWLEFKRRVSDSPNDLPNKEATIKRLQQLFSDAIHNSQLSQPAIYDWGKKHSYDIQEADVLTAALVEVVDAKAEMPASMRDEDIAFLDNYGGKVTFAKLGCWGADETFVIICQWALLYQEAEEVQYVHAVREIHDSEPKDSESDFSAMGIVLKALRFQAMRGLSLQVCWAAAPYSFRREHPMCPCCGSPNIRTMRAGEFETGGDWLGCDACDWVAHDTETKTTFDLADRDEFLKELAYIQKKNRQESELREAIAQAKKASKNIEKLVVSYRKEHLPDSEMAKDLLDLSKELEATSKKMRGLTGGK